MGKLKREIALDAKQQAISVDLKKLNDHLDALNAYKNIPLITSFTAKENVFTHFIELQGNVQTKQNMTPKEKAIELLDKYLNIEDADDCSNSYPYVARQCALICIDEMFSIYDNEGYDSEHYKMVYLKEVKQELNKL